MNTQASDQNKFFRFQVFQGETNQEGNISKSKSVGMAYLREGQNIFTLRLWMFMNERYYLVPSKQDPSKYLVMTREPNKNPNGKNKYFWNIVGNATIESAKGIIEIDFDLLSETVYMNIYPESSAYSVTLSPPEEIVEAA